jgi:hypothetical protein
VLDARLTTLLCKKMITVKPKVVKTGWSYSQEWSNLAEFSKEGYGYKNGCFINNDDDYIAVCGCSMTNNKRF